LQRLLPTAVVIAALGAAALLVATGAAGATAGATPLMRVELHLQPDARTKPQLVLMTAGGRMYCVQLETLARKVGASLVCTDYAANRYLARGERSARQMDWGDPAYLAQVARVPTQLRVGGVKIAKLVLVGVSYSGYANAELVATHPELRPAALVVVDSYLDLPARYRALPPGHETKAELERAMGGTLDKRRKEYARRSPSNNLDGLARAIRGGMRFVDVWSTSPGEEREFRGATCSRLANGHWLALLATRLGEPVTGYVTQMPHAHALWDRGQGLLQLAGVRSTTKPLLARRVTFAPRAAKLPAGSYCGS
jgi:pimeloyl-ACP methyl ester carboxylesterase